MEMEMVDRQQAGEQLQAAEMESGLRLIVERLAAAASALEQMVGAQRSLEDERAMMATVERRESELERRLEAAEAELATLRAQAATPSAERQASGAAGVQRKTVPAAVTHLLAKQGVSLESMGESMQAGALDAALASLSLEQRIAVKAQLLRAGMLG